MSSVSLLLLRFFVAAGEVKTAFDQVLLRGEGLSAVAALQVPAAAAVAASAFRLPHADWPSDHLSLVVEFELEPG